MNTDPRTTRVIRAFENLSPDTLQALIALYAEQATFKDPFNDVSGQAAIAVLHPVDVPFFAAIAFFNRRQATVPVLLAVAIPFLVSRRADFGGAVIAVALAVPVPEFRAG